MSDRPCQHPVLGDVIVARCLPHSQVSAGIDVWVWSTEELPPLRCACEVATDRFLIATDEADAWSAPSADVVLGSTQSTLRAALAVAKLRLDRLPGCRLVAVPAGRQGAVFRTRTHRLVVAAERFPPTVCEVCLYPWLCAGHTLDELL